MHNLVRLTLVLVVGTAVVGPAAAALPQFAFRGQPAFVSGFWGHNDVYGPDDNYADIRNIAMSSSGYVYSISTALRMPNATAVNPYSMTSFTTRSLSYECIDDRTYLNLYNYTGYYLFNTSGTHASLGGGQEPLACAIRRVDGNLLRTAAVQLVNDSVTCPTVSDLPTGNVTGGSRDGDVIKFIFRRIPSAVQTVQTMCVNQSSTTQWTLPLPDARDPPAAVGQPCATYTNTAIPAGPVVTQGNWMADSGTDMMTDSRLGWVTTEWSTDPSALAITMGLYTSSQCESSNSAKSASYVYRRFINGTVQAFWVCDKRTREDLAGGVKMTLDLSAPIPFKASFNQYGTLPDNPDRTCPAPTPTPAPSPAPSTVSCTYRGIWRIGPLHAPCRSKYLSYVRSSCANTTVALRTAKAVHPQRVRLIWGLNHDYKATGGANVNGASTASIVAMKNLCKITNLAGAATDSPTAPQLSLRRAAYGFKVIPTGRGTDCTSVYIYSTERAKKGLNPYLTVPNTCDGFAWAPAPGGRSQFRLIKESEVNPQV